jgi:superfamily II DNA helicase RecQ
MEDRLSSIRSLALPDLQIHFTASIPLTLRPRDAFLHNLPAEDRTRAMKMCLLVWEVSKTFKSQICPREWQLEAALASLNNRAAIINVGTGQGKTLCGILPQLLHPDSVSIVLSPLKRLMAVQAKEYVEWGIKAVVINEDTSKSKSFWEVCHTATILFLRLSS